jgi:hypothetical protein
MKNYITKHTSFETAYKVENYPYGFRLRTTMHYWIETVAKKGDRLCTCTINPKNGRINAPKKSTFSNIGILYLDENNHVHWDTINIYTKPNLIVDFINNTIGEDKLNEEQKKQYRQLIGKKVVEVDELTGKKKKDFSIKWGYEIVGSGWEGGKYNNGEKGKCNEVKITFDRPDGVNRKEIFEAMKTLNQDKLKEVFEIRKSPHWGEYSGTVRICVRGGVQLGTVSEETYNNYLASDENTVEEEKLVEKY